MNPSTPPIKSHPAVLARHGRFLHGGFGRFAGGDGLGRGPDLSDLRWVDFGGWLTTCIQNTQNYANNLIY